MSINALEKALWQAYTCHADTDRLNSDAAAYASGFDLDGQERAMLIDNDVVGQIAYGANPLLVMMVWQARCGVANLGEYFALVNGATPAAA